VTRDVARGAALLVAASLLVCVAPVRAQGVGPNVVIPNTRPHTSLQIMGSMQVPWTVEIHPSANSVAIGNCQGIYIDLFDPKTKDVPRSPTGQRVSIADFDWTATGNLAVGKYDGPNAWKVCACPGAVIGSTIHVMATYPAVSLSEKAKVPGLAFQSYIELPIMKAYGGNVPPGCDNTLVTTTVAIAVPGGGAPPTAVGGGRSPLTNPPVGSTAPASPPASTAPGYSVTPAGSTAPPTALPAAGAGQGGAAIPTAQPYLPPAQLAPPAATQVVPVNPQNFKAVQAGPAMVVLTWDPVPGVAFYQVWGSGLPNTGATVSAGTAQVVNNVPSGMQTWSVGSFYTPGPVSTSASVFTKTQLQVSPTFGSTASPPSGTAYPPGGNSSGSPPANAPTPTNAPASNRYRVVATGFRVLHQTKDDFFSRDGHGDEVYGGFMTFHYDRNTSKLVDQSLRRTNVIGEHGYDGLGFGDRLIRGVGGAMDLLTTGADPAVKSARIKGGTATPDGGFAQNDVFPAVADPSKTYGAAPTNNTFPFLVWEGPLTDGQDAVVILPSMWEFDGFPDGFNKWHQSEQANVLQIWSDQGVQAAVAGTQLAMLSPPGTLETSFGLHYSASNAFELVFVGAVGPLSALIAGSYDRPIGVKMNGVGGTGGMASGPSMPRRAVVITREIMEATLAKQATYNPATTAPGVFQIYGAPPVILPTPPPGTLAVQLFESPAEDLQGMYILYLQIERVNAVVH
jgi:hypothetical protein